LEGSKNVRIFETEIRYEKNEVGGIAVYLSENNDQLLFGGRIAPAGVPGIDTGNIGGIAFMSIRGSLRNLLMTGDVVGNGALVGGIIPRIYVTDNFSIINAEMRGNVISTGSTVGGIAGGIWDGQRPFGLDYRNPHPALTKDRSGHECTSPFFDYKELYRPFAIIRAKVTGNIWGGMTRKQLECIDQVAKILGVGGGTDCIGDIKNQSGGRSYVGGIVGYNSGLIQDSEFTGTVRGVSAVGGIAGGSGVANDSHSRSVANYVRNRSAGTVSASESAKDYGALIGRAEFLAGTIQPRLDSNVITPGEGNPTWAIGTWGKEIQSPITSNVPEYYDR
jgi:hypothetical protein